MTSHPSTLFYLGASHRRTPLELRERLALDADNLARFRTTATATPGLREFAALGTCNRLEFYAVADSPAIASQLEHAFCLHQNIPANLFADIREHGENAAALRHLIEVAAGLDSQMLGENEIFGQVKAAFADAQKAGHVGPILNRVFQKTFQIAKYVRTHTAITEGRISTANVAVDLALNIFGSLAHTRILLLGAGEIGEKTARAFQSRGATTLTVASRTLTRAMDLARGLDASALPFEHFTHHLHQFDIVVCSTAAPGSVISSPDVAAAMRLRPAKPLFFIDLALPRDVAPEIASLENVFLFNLDDLAAIAEQNRAARATEVARARLITTERSTSLWNQLAPRLGQPVVTAPPPASFLGRPARPGE